jgi:chemotaxis protein methyltransferase CheR
MQPDKSRVVPALLALPLAQGELAPEEAAELHALKDLIHDRLGIHCDGYKEKCLRRRIAVRMRARGAHTYAAYAALLDGDVEEYQRLRDTITINVSKFFRNQETWSTIRTMIVPALFALRDREIRIWSAGVAGGEEAYSFAILLREYAEQHGGDLSRFRILGTDIDRQSLANAERGEYGEFSFTETDDATRARWFDGAGTWRVKPEVRAMVELAHLDLMKDPFPAAQHVILCRNVIIYFERMLQERLFGEFRDALQPGAHLVLGKVEALFGPAAHAFLPVAGRERIFRKV